MEAENHVPYLVGERVPSGRTRICTWWEWTKKYSSRTLTAGDSCFIMLAMDNLGNQYHLYEWAVPMEYFILAGTQCTLMNSPVGVAGPSAAPRERHKFLFRAAGAAHSGAAAVRILGAPASEPHIAAELASGLGLKTA